MKSTSWLFACAFIAACAPEGSRQVIEANAAGDPEATIASELGAPVILDVNAQAPGGLDRIQQLAQAASADACHGKTTCTGGSPIGPFFTIDCGEPLCGTEATCGKFVKWMHLLQPQEQYQGFAMPDGKSCLAYRPAGTRDLGCNRNLCPFDP